MHNSMMTTCSSSRKITPGLRVARSMDAVSYDIKADMSNKRITISTLWRVTRSREQTETNSHLMETGSEQDNRQQKGYYPPLMSLKLDADDPWLLPFSLAFPVITSPFKRICECPRTLRVDTEGGLLDFPGEKCLLIGD